jgi:parallel beta-helix repeat protein
MDCGSISNSIVTNNVVVNASSGVYVYGDYLTIDNNTISDCIYNGIVMAGDDNTVSNNTLDNNGYRGIYMTGNNNVIHNNVIKNNGVFGIILISGATGNRIYNNTIRDNTHGLNITGSNYNTIYHNNFLNNNGTNSQAFDDGTNWWNATYPTGGNYWSDYVGIDAFSGVNQDIPGSDGLGDTVHTFTGSQDNYPLMFQSVWWNEVAPVITLVSPANNSAMQPGIIDFYIWDENFNLDSSNYSVDGGPDTAFGVNYDIDASGWADGNYVVVVNAVDDLGNTAYGLYNIRVDTADPAWTIELAISNDLAADGCINTGDTLMFWMNITDDSEDASTIPVIDVDETDFPDQVVSALTYAGAGFWTFIYTVQAGGFNISNVDIQFTDMAGKQ